MTWLFEDGGPRRTTGRRIARATTGSGIQWVLFPTPGYERDFYVCSFFAVSA